MRDMRRGRPKPISVDKLLGNHPSNDAHRRIDSASVAAQNLDAGDVADFGSLGPRGARTPGKKKVSATRLRSGGESAAATSHTPKGLGAEHTIPRSLWGTSLSKQLTVEAALEFIAHVPDRFDWNAFLRDTATKVIPSTYENQTRAFVSSDLRESLADALADGGRPRETNVLKRIIRAVRVLAEENGLAPILIGGHRDAQKPFLHLVPPNLDSNFSPLGEGRLVLAHDLLGGETQVDARVLHRVAIGLTEPPPGLQERVQQLPTYQTFLAHYSEAAAGSGDVPDRLSTDITRIVCATALLLEDGSQNGDLLHKKNFPEETKKTLTDIAMGESGRNLPEPKVPREL